MTSQNSDPIALAAQADIHRFFTRLIHPALIEFAPGPDVSGGEVDSLEVFLENAGTATHNALCYEMRRAFGLVVGAMFERQLRFWLASGAADKREDVQHAKLPALEAMIEELRGISLQLAGVADDIQELWSVSNAVRHGEGYSIKKLALQNPRLWDHLRADTLKGESARLVSNMRVTDADLRRYTLAVMKFWLAAGASSIPDM